METKVIRILHYIGSLNIGGSQSMIMNIYRNIDRNKIQFDFVIDKPNETFYQQEIEKLGGKVFYLERYKGYNHFKYKKQWKKFFDIHSEYKIIHSHIRSTASIVLSIAKKNKLITISHSHSNTSGTGIKALVKNLFQYRIRYIADYFFACSQDAGQWLFGEKIVNQKNFRVINNAIDTATYSFNSTIRKDVRKKFDVDENTTIFGNIGRMCAQKNQIFMIDVFKKVNDQNPNTLLYIIGDGIEKEKIESRISELNLDKKVKLLGMRNDIPELLQAIDIFWFPSLYEGLGIVAIEAQAAGLPTLISENVPKEVELTNLIYRIPLNNETEWVNTSLKISQKINERHNYDKIIKDNHFDIVSESKELAKFYVEVSNK